MQKIKFHIQDLDPKTLTEYKDYIGYLFKNEMGVISQLNSEEDIAKSNQWFKSLPIRVAVLDVNDYSNNINAKVGDIIYPNCNSLDLKHTVFQVISITESGLVKLEDQVTKEIINSTEFILLSPIFLRWANDEDKKYIVNNQDKINFNINQ